MAALRERFPFRRVARLVGWNALVLFALLLLAGGGAEVWLRLTIPFREQARPVRLVPGVGELVSPRAEVRRTDGREFWQASRANSLGFLDREPPDPERAAESCHVTLIGDSFVHAAEVPIREKAQVRLEALAAREAPGLDVTASAFAYPGTGQISQLAYYDAYARSLSPDVVALVFVHNDFFENSLLWGVWHWGFSPDHPPRLYAWRGPAGEMEFVPPASSLDEVRANLLPRLPARAPLWSRVEWKLREWSYLADWFWIRSGHVWRKAAVSSETRLAWMEAISRDPRYAALAEALTRKSNTGFYAIDLLLEEDPLPVYREALDVTRFALEQFRERAERDGAALVILASHTLGGGGDGLFELLRGLAGDIPAISQSDHVVAAGGEVRDLHWAHDFHWNPTGHLRAAEAILEWLKENPEVCD